MVACSEVEREPEFLCDRLCSVKKSCGRHRCNARCCNVGTTCVVSQCVGVGVGEGVSECGCVGRCGCGRVWVCMCVGVYVCVLVVWCGVSMCCMCSVL